MEEPRPEKVAVVEEVRGKLSEADALLITEYRGLTVSDLAELRGAMRGAGGEYRIYKNTLVRRAAAELDLDIADMLSGPTALTFVNDKADGSPGDVATVAKAIREFAKGNPNLVVKGGMLGETLLDESGAKALASLPAADEIYSRIAGGLSSGARGLAGVVSGVHRSLAYALQAAVDAGGFAGGAEPAPAAETTEAASPEAVSQEEASSPEEAAPEQPAPAEEAASAATEETAPEEAAAPEASESAVPDDADSAGDTEQSDEAEEKES